MDLQHDRRSVRVRSPVGSNIRNLRIGQIELLGMLGFAGYDGPDLRFELCSRFSLPIGGLVTGAADLVDLSLACRYIRRDRDARIANEHCRKTGYQHSVQQHGLLLPIPGCSLTNTHTPGIRINTDV
jgi:hypothetical protein